MFRGLVNKGIFRVVVQLGGLKAAHFYAPRGSDNHYVSGSMPPGFMNVFVYQSKHVAKVIVASARIDVVPCTNSSLSPNVMSIGSTVFAGLTVVLNRQIDRATAV